MQEVFGISHFGLGVNDAAEMTGAVLDGIVTDGAVMNGSVANATVANDTETTGAVTDEKPPPKSKASASKKGKKSVSSTRNRTHQIIRLQ